VQHRLAVGIDLGTTNSLVATVRSGLAKVLNDEQGRPLLPSIVRYHADGSTDVGYEAQKQQAKDPKNTIVSVKRFMGRGLKDIAHVESMPYDFIEALGMVKVKTVAGVKSPVEVSADILKTLRQRAEAALDGELVGAVITVLFRRRPAPGHQGRGAPRWPQRPAPAQRTHGSSHRLRPGQCCRGRLCGL